MWCSKSRAVTFAGLLVVTFGLQACTVEPMNATRPSVASASLDATVAAQLAATTVAAVESRVAQQVRNELLFALNGGTPASEALYTVTLNVTSVTSYLSVETQSKAPHASQVKVDVSYQLKEISGGKVVATGTRTGLSPFDRTPQSFANQRAERNAENLAAKSVAQSLRLALAQALTK